MCLFLSWRRVESRTENVFYLSSVCKAMSTKLERWTPVRTRKIYCSPGCGGKCTCAAFLLASKQAKRLAKRLGTDWKPNVWENLGWYYKVEHVAGFMTVYQTGRTFIGYLGENGAGRWVCTARSPQAAVRAVRNEARNEIIEIERMLWNR